MPNSKAPKPLIFIGSASENIKVAEAIQENLQHISECMVWSQGVFELNQTAIDSMVLANKKYNFDFAIFVVAGNDILESREEHFVSPRDNVIFEIGLFMGALTKDRVFIVTDKSVHLKLPSDFIGVQPATYSPPERGNINSAIGVATTQIKRRIEELGLISTTGIDQTANTFDEFKQLIRKFDEIIENDEVKKFALKEQAGAKLGEFVISASISKSAITNLYSEGSMVALIFSIMIKPEKKDFENLEKIYHRTVQPFARHRLLDAIKVLFTKSYISKSEIDQVRDILTFYSKDCQPVLMKKIIKLNEIIDELGMIKKYSMKDGNLKMGETIKIAQGNPRLTTFNDPILQETMVVDGIFGSDALDIIIDVNGKVVSEIEYIYWDHGRFILYAHVHAKKEFSTETADLWMPFRTDITQIEFTSPGIEVAVPVSSSQILDHWKKITVNLSQATELAFGKDGWSYVNLNKLRIRGSGKLKSIILR